MNEPITFFRKRQQNAGYTYAFDLQSSNRVYRVFIYSRREIEEAVIRSRKVVEWEPEKDRIFQAVGPGGAIVWAYEEAGKRFFRAVPAGAEGSIFRSYGVLRPGVELSLAEVSDKWLETPLGTHLMVPVDREAEEHLRDLKGYLEWLSADLESLILYAIRKPSLDARIRDLEERSAKVAGRPVVSQIQERLIPILLVLIVLLNVGMLFLNFDLFLQASQHTGGSAEAEEKQETSKPPEGRTPNPAKAKVHDQKIFAILQTVQDKAESVPAFEGLHNGNFEGLAQEQQVVEVLKDRKRAQPLVLGLMKLEALRLDATKTPDGLFTISNNPSALKEAFRQIGQKAVDDDKKARDLLAALGCLIHGVPGLPKSTPTGGRETPAHLFVQSQQCENFSLEKATSGLENLLDFVIHYSPS